MSIYVNPLFLSKVLIWFVLLFLFFCNQNVRAEYRAYQYMIAPANADQKKSSVITSSLNPVAMTRYYGISKNNLYLLRTWICPGHTGGKKTCIPPYQEIQLENFLQEKQQGQL